MRFSSRPDRTAMSVSPFRFRVLANSMQLEHVAGLQEPFLSSYESTVSRARYLFSFECVNLKSHFHTTAFRIDSTRVRSCAQPSGGASVRTSRDQPRQSSREPKFGSRDQSAPFPN